MEGFCGEAPVSFGRTCTYVCRLAEWVMGGPAETVQVREREGKRKGKNKERKIPEHGDRPC